MADLVVFESNKRISSAYSKSHRGIDLKYRKKEIENIVYPNSSGIVVKVKDGLGNLKGSSGTISWGNYVLIKHDNGYYSRYAHLKKGILVKENETVHANTKLGIIGNSGNSYGRHLHFEVQKGLSSATRINPFIYLSKSISGNNKKIYIVKKGDTLSSIAKKMNTTYLKIYQDNKEVIDNTAKRHGVKSNFMNYLYIGEKLFLEINPKS